MSAPDVSVVMPCLNEAQSIGGCIEEARSAFARAGMSHEIVVADNGSTDGSREIAERAGARVITEATRGYGAAVSSAVEASAGRTILISDSDGTYPLHQGPEVVRAARQGSIALGSRFSGRIEPGAMPALHRLVGSPLTRLLLAVLFGVHSSDPHSGFRAMRREVFETVRPRSKGWEFTVEMLVNARRRGIDVAEIPIDYGGRLGASKLRALPDGWAFFKFLVLHSPTFLYLVPAIATMTAGIALLTWLAVDDRRFAGGITLGVNSLVVGALLLIAGHQIAILGLSARVYLRNLEAGARASSAHLPRWFSLERGIACGTVLVAAGLGLVAAIAAQWWSIDFAPLSRTNHGLVVVGATITIVGMQTMFGSFFLTMIGDPFSSPADRSPRS